jgi:hypothetical protein
MRKFVAVYGAQWNCKLLVLLGRWSQVMRLPTFRLDSTRSRAIEAHDGDNEIYRDNRETRTFCPERYQRSFDLPNIIRTLERRRCEFARGMSVV